MKVNCALCWDTGFKHSSFRSYQNSLIKCWCCHGIGHAEDAPCPELTRTGETRRRPMPTETPEDRPDEWPTRAELEEGR